MIYQFFMLITMMFCHIVDEYYLQGWFASAKQKSWWEKNTSNPLYKNDYIVALLEHAFSWTFMIHLPFVVYAIICDFQPNIYIFVTIFIINWVVHIVTDHAKANLMKINLIQDQMIHFCQIVVTWLIYMLTV